MAKMVFDMDTLLSHLGKPGRYQILVCLLLSLNYFQLSFNHLGVAFSMAPPLSFRCGDHDTANASGQGMNVTDGFCPLLKSDTWCEMRENCSSCDSVTPYVTEEREWTVVTEFDLVCDQRYLSSLSTSIYFLGVLVGGMVFGHIADAIGRFPVLIACMYLPIAVGIGIFFSQSYTVFTLLRFIMGFLMQGLQIVSLSTILEYFSPQYRGIAVCSMTIVWSSGGFVLSLTAFLIRHWRWMQLCFSLLVLISIIYVWLLPESLRWLLSKRKYDRAETLTKRIAKFNGLKEIPPEVTTIFKEHKTFTSDTVVYNLSHILRNRNTLIRSIILWYIWFTVSLGYYGLNFSTGTLYGFKYSNFVIGVAVEIVSFTLTIFVAYYVNRRPSIMAFFLCGGIACIASGVIENRTAKSVLALAGRFGMGGAFNLIFVQTSELYPTVMRSVGLGLCFFWTRLGGLLAPQINLLGTMTYQTLPVIMFGAFSIGAAILVLILPETMNRDLPDTIEDSENMGWGCWCKSASYKLQARPEKTKSTTEV